MNGQLALPVRPRPLGQSCCHEGVGPQCFELLWGAPIRRVLVQFSINVCMRDEVVFRLYAANTATEISGAAAGFPARVTRLN
jgi:hypothetical protein